MINFAQFKRFFISCLIGSLVAAALVAVVVVLIGQSNEITTRVFVTLFMVVLHSLISLLFIWDDSRRNTFSKLSFFINTIFVLIVMSFIASLFGIWKIVSADNVFNLYLTFFLIGFASLHADMLLKAMGKEKYMDKIIYANYIFIAAVVLLYLPIIFIKNAETALPDIYFRFLAATGIIDGTLSILTIIFYKLYMHKHPKAEDIFQAGVPVKGGQIPRRGLSVWFWILIAFLVFTIGFPFVIGLFMSSLLIR